MIKFPNSILDKVNILLNLQVGDISRLEHVKKMILEDKPLYSSDKQYVENLASMYINDNQEKTKLDEPVLVNCRNCSTAIPRFAKFCTLCGTRQKREYSNIDITRIVKYNPIHLIPKPNSYQTLAIVGGLAAIIPILFIMARMDPLLEAINYDTGMDLSERAGIFLFLGSLSSILSMIAIAITFVIKNPKKVGRILFFMAFAILASSILIGIVGFIFILFASNVAYKKRGY